MRGIPGQPSAVISIKTTPPFNTITPSGWGSPPRPKLRLGSAQLKEFPHNQVGMGTNIFAVRVSFTRSTLRVART